MNKFLFGLMAAIMIVGCSQKGIVKEIAEDSNSINEFDKNYNPDRSAASTSSFEVVKKSSKGSYVKDLTRSGPALVWSPISTKRMPWKTAMRQCSLKRDLGLRWRLPKKEDLSQAFGGNIKNVLSIRDPELWSSENLFDFAAWGYDTNKKVFDDFAIVESLSFVCVGQ